jgi:hypothetical protein
MPIQHPLWEGNGFDRSASKKGLRQEAWAFTTGAS